jgi:hypothetical protein
MLSSQHIAPDATALMTVGDSSMTSSKMPRRFWSYTAGKGNTRTEEMEAARERKLREVRQTLPGLLAFGAVLLLTLVMLFMLLAEYRGFYLDQIMEILRPG